MHRFRKAGVLGSNPRGGSEPTPAAAVTRGGLFVIRIPSTGLALAGELRGEPVLSRPVLIVADDYGIGPETSRGILDLACEGRLTATVLIVNGPDAERAVRAWKAANPPADLGWHPNLTLDSPVLSPADIPSLVRPDGTFWSLGSFLRRLCFGLIRREDVRAEWFAQFRRFVELVGEPPALVNSHQHVSLFPPCDTALFDVLDEVRARPYLRRVTEPVRTLINVPGARLKRTALTVAGRRAARRAAARGFVGCDWLVGVTDPAWVADPRFWERWLTRVGPTGSVEVCCHPGYEDPTLVGRDCDAGVGVLRRPRELALLRDPSFRAACDRAGLTPMRPSEYIRGR